MVNSPVAASDPIRNAETATTLDLFLARFFPMPSSKVVGVILSARDCTIHLLLHKIQLHIVQLSYRGPSIGCRAPMLLLLSTCVLSSCFPSNCASHASLLIVSNF